MFNKDVYLAESKADGKANELAKLRHNQPAIVNALIDDIFLKVPKGDGMTFTMVNKVFEKDPWVNIFIYK